MSFKTSSQQVYKAETQDTSTGIKQYLKLKSFENKCIIISYFLNQSGFAPHCSLVGLKMLVFICSVYTIKKSFSGTVSTRSMVRYSCTRKYSRMNFLFNLLQLHLSLTQLFTQDNKHLIRHQSYRRVLIQSYGHHLVFHTGTFSMLE